LGFCVGTAGPFFSSAGFCTRRDTAFARDDVGTSFGRSHDVVVVFFLVIVVFVGTVFIFVIFVGRCDGRVC
jgi:hypothetical protein